VALHPEEKGMKIHFAEIPEEGLRLQIADDSWFPEQEVTRCGPVTASVFLQRQEQRVFMEGTIEASIRLSCDRCLESFCNPLSSFFKIDIELVEYLPASEEHVCGREEMDMMFVDKPEVDVFHVLAQQVYLSLSIKRLCRENCAGLCSLCGVNLNVEQCDCRSERKNKPFSVLASLSQDRTKKKPPQ
jgi:uncharacterized protein